MKHTPRGKLLTEVILQAFKLNGLLISEGDELVKELGLTSARWKVLGALSNSPLPVTVSDIARLMGQSRQAVQRIANEMTTDGLLVALENPEHKRAKLLKLTQKGKLAYDRAMEKQIPWVNSIAGELKETDLKSVSSVLNKLINQFDT